MRLNDPESRWAGIMRYMSNNDFQAANYEFIEFWLLNPFGENPSGETPHSPDEVGYLTFHLGNVSEDILPDNLQFYENALPEGDDIVRTTETPWGQVPIDRPLNDAFNGTDFSSQDVGLDGLNDTLERQQFAEWLQNMPLALDDPCGDNFEFFNNIESDDLLERYKFNSNPEGNSPDVSGNNRNNFQRGNPIPDKEDLNNNRSLDQQESFWEYRVPIKATSDHKLDTLYDPYDYIRETKEVQVNGGTENWYRIRIPLNGGKSINGIDGFRSIQFIRMLVEDFAHQTTFRMADFELIRNQWRRQPTSCARDGSIVNLPFSTDIVGVEENRDKSPFGYRIPPGIKQERLFSTFSPINQDENSLVLKFRDLPAVADTTNNPRCNVSVLKLTELDLRVYDRMQMLVHGETPLDNPSGVQDDDLSVFIRVGKDFTNHFYEYEIPLKLSPLDERDNCEDFCLWPEENMFDFPLDLFIQAKKLRNVSKHPVLESFVMDRNTLQEASSQQLQREFLSITDSLANLLPEGHKVRIVGNPNLGRVKGINIGVRNNDPDRDLHTAEIWINELRLAGLQERGGAAAQARLDIQLADLGGVSASASMNTLGWGALDQKVNERAKEAVIEYDVATNLELGKLFPANWGMRVPFYAQYATEITNPEFDAYDLDITVDDEFDLLKNEGPAVLDDVSQRNQTVNTIKTFNFTNVRKERGTNANTARNRARERDKDRSGRTDSSTVADGSGKEKKERKPMPWNIENFSASYSYTETEYRDQILEQDNSVDQRLGIDYNFSRKGGYIEPFKKVKSKHLKILKEFNFNLLPNSLSVNSTLNRYFAKRRFRLPLDPLLEFDDNRFTWERRYDLTWNLTKALKLNFDALNKSYIDEARQVGIEDTPEARPWLAFTEVGNGILETTDVTDQVNSNPNFVEDYWKTNLRSGGRNTDYNHAIGLSYKLPLRYLPYMDWVDVSASYRSNFVWTAGSIIPDAVGNPLGGVIQNDQDRSLTANLNFDKLYKKSKYVKNLDRTKSKNSRRRRTTGDRATVSQDKDGKRVAKKKTREATTLEKLLVRPLFSLRSARLTFREDFSTVVPGYLRTPDFFGLDQWDAPGYGFVLGLQPDIDPNNPNNYLDRAATNGWVTNSSGQNQEVIQTRSQSYEAKFKIEPWKDFKIDVDFKKNHRETHSEVFKFIDDPAKDTLGTGIGFQRLAARDLGSFDLTYYTLNTLFGFDRDDLFDQFLLNRQAISNRLPNVEDPGEHSVDGQLYAQGFGRQSSAVIIPAFIAAYTNQSPNEVDLDLENQVSRRGFLPRPNWRLVYNGLSKLPWFRDKFSSFTLEHAYQNQLRVSSFNTDVEFDSGDPFARTRLNGNYYTRVEIPAVQIAENFNPVIGLKMKTKKDFTFEVAYNKSRDLNLRINTSSQLEEVAKESFVLGVGYTIKDSKFLKKNKKNTRGGRTTRDRDKDKDKDNDEDKNKRNVTSTRGSDMTFMLNVSFDDNATFVHEIDKEKTVDGNAIRGDRGFQINPTVDYILNDNVTLRAFFDYNTNQPYGPSPFKRTSIATGVTVRLTLN